MDDRLVFEHLFKVAGTSKDPEGVVAACLVKDGKILVSSPSAQDGIRHAEDLVIEKFNKLGLKMDKEIVLYTTLEPCSYRNPINKVDDCTTIIMKSGVKNVVFGALDPEFSKEARNRFLKEKVNYRQVEDKNLITKSIQLFNSTITIPLTSMNLPRAKKLPNN